MAVENGDDVGEESGGPDDPGAHRTFASTIEKSYFSMVPKYGDRRQFRGGASSSTTSIGNEIIGWDRGHRNSPWREPRSRGRGPRGAREGRQSETASLARWYVFNSDPRSVAAHLTAGARVGRGRGVLSYRLDELARISASVPEHRRYRAAWTARCPGRVGRSASTTTTTVAASHHQRVASPRLQLRPYRRVLRQPAARRRSSRLLGIQRAVLGPRTEAGASQRPWEPTQQRVCSPSAPTATRRVGSSITAWRNWSTVSWR